MKNQHIMHQIKSLTSGNVLLFKSLVPKKVAIGVIAVILMYVAVAGTLSSVVPWSNRSDTQYHIDYVWNVYNGQLPTFQQGITYPPLASHTAHHLTASHPPFFYAIHAAIIGEMLKDGQWEKAIATGRAVNIFIGVLCIIALAWGGWVFGGKMREPMAVAVPAIGALFYRFTTLNINFANDVLLVLLATLAMVIMYKMFKNGLLNKYIIALAVISILGIATKATYVVVLAVTLLAIPIAGLLHMKHDAIRSIVVALLKAVTIAVVVVASVGWFYYLNYQSSGSWFKSSPDDFTGGRDYKTLGDVIGGEKLWALFYAHSSNVPPLSIAVTAIAAAGMTLVLPVRNVVSKIKTAVSTHKALSLTVLFLVVIVIGVLITQIRHAVGYGSINFRYLLPALLPISLFLAYGLLQFKPTRGCIVSISVIVIAATTLLPLADSSKIRNQIPAVQTAHNNIEQLLIASSHNGVPIIVNLALLMGFVIGSFVLVWALYQLTSPKKTSNTEVGRS